MYISPFVPHTFTSRNKSNNGLILALTYGNKLSGDVKQELSSLSTKYGSQFSLDFSTRESASGSLLKFHREISSLTLDEISTRTKISKNIILELETSERLPNIEELSLLANSYNINSRELLPPDLIDNNVIVSYYDKARRWYYPENSTIYEFVELASTRNLPFSKTFEINVQNPNGIGDEFKIGLHQFIYNVGDTTIQLNWMFDDKKHTKEIHPGDTLYIKPFLQHNFSGVGKLVVLRVGGKIPGDSQRELSALGKRNTRRAIDESIQWFDPKGKN
jgi:methylphosphonate synthase